MFAKLKLPVLIQLKYYAKWLLFSGLIGILSGSASALFLAFLARATLLRQEHLRLIYWLPVGGFAIGWLYHKFGKKVEGGNNLILEELHDPKETLPLRMAPLVLLGTVVTHLFGGSAGREGTAVQMGASLADQLRQFLKIDQSERKIWLMAGMSAGFGSVFGVPLAGTIFGLEVLSIGPIGLRPILECAVAALVAHATALAWGTQHSHYSIVPVSFNLNLIYLIPAGLVFGGAARLFSYGAEEIKNRFKKWLPYLPLRTFVGGIAVASIFILYPLTLRYSGLGVEVIQDSLRRPVPAYDWLGKLLMTALTLGTGFKGGEVTPLLFIGSTLGNALSLVLPLALPILAAAGFVAVFAGAANTPLTCTIMAMELFGLPMGLAAGIACYASYLISGHHGIYSSQKILRPKKLK
jgi:H+/Cl- antiporter ClcA